MKFPTSLSWFVLLAGTATVATAADVKDLVVLNFKYMARNSIGEPQKSYEYAFGDWEGKHGVFQVSDKGVIANHIGSKGGLGENRGLDFRKHTKARFDFVIGNRNQAESFGFSLADRDGTEQSFDISLKGLPRGAPLHVVLDLTHPSREDKPGKTPGLDLKKLKSWQIKGNYQDPPIEILIEKVTAQAE